MSSTRIATRKNRRFGLRIAETVNLFVSHVLHSSIKTLRSTPVAKRNPLLKSFVSAVSERISLIIPGPYSDISKVTAEKLSMYARFALVPEWGKECSKSLSGMIFLNRTAMKSFRSSMILGSFER